MGEWRGVRVERNKLDGGLTSVFSFSVGVNGIPFSFSSSGISKPGGSK